ncbi:MAG: hypothetical protein HKN25_06345 [Pyrinomonadaceae bacterium]|nr:hypothetical protein [Pyrinomonadaceae bacterium]
MKNSEQNKEKVIQYLYGELIESEREDFENRIFEDQDLAMFLEEVETDLIDEYIKGELEFDEKRLFEKKYLTAVSRRERVDLARTISAKILSEDSITVESNDNRAGFWASVSSLFGGSNPALAGGLAVLLILTLFGAYWLIVSQDSKPPIAADNSNQIEETPIARETPEPDNSPEPVNERERPANTTNERAIETNVNQNRSLEKPLEKAAPTPKPVKSPPKPKTTPKAIPKQPTVYAFSLMPPLRSSSSPVLRIPQSVKTVRLRLFENFGPNYEKFVIGLNGPGGNTIWNGQVVESKKRLRRSISISIPAAKFNRGKHEIVVHGVTEEGSKEEINFYNFIVERTK